MSLIAIFNFSITLLITLFIFVSCEGEMMALDAEPFALVEREGFKRLISTVVPRYSMPCRTRFSRKVMPEMHAEIASKIREKLCDAESVSFTTDIWTNSANNEAFISLTAHFILPSTMKQMIYTLATKHFPESHTGSNINEILNEILNEWQLQEKQLHLIVRDNAANMAVGTGERHIYYIIYIINYVSPSVSPSPPFTLLWEYYRSNLYEICTSDWKC
jgi:hypothetical protein